MNTERDNERALLNEVQGRRTDLSLPTFLSKNIPVLWHRYVGQLTQLKWIVLRTCLMAPLRGPRSLLLALL